ncbi:MAG: hypothetical protein ACXWI4_10400, partial [Croceibacterium sp.]
YFNGRNVMQGWQTGEFYARRTLHKRSEGPDFFWIAFGISAVFAIAGVIGTALSVWGVFHYR